MKRILVICLSFGLSAVAPVVTQAADKLDPAAELAKFQAYFQKQFPEVAFQDFANGAYALDADARANWEAIEEFPPYEIALEEGQQLFETPFANGKTYASCFANGGIGIRQNFPYFDSESGQVRTLEQDINACREKNGEKPLPWKKGDIASISAYMAFTSRDNVIDIKIPDDPRALAAYEQGRHHYYSKRGQLNFACADCHVYSAGKLLRTEKLSPSLGHPTHFPVYRSKWGEMGTLHRRFVGCNEEIRAKPFEPQSEEYRNLEYFLTYMSNGLKINGPGARK